jgi:hypothetical protein
MDRAPEVPCSWVPAFAGKRKEVSANVNVPRQPPAGAVGGVKNRPPTAQSAWATSSNIT